MKTKVCTKCGEEKGLEEFNKKKSGKYGRMSECKACRRAYREDNKDKISAKNKAYYEANREQELARAKEYREANKQEILTKRKERYHANREQELAWNKAYRQANRDEILAYKKEYREVNKEKISLRKKIYRKKRYAEDPVFRTKMALRRQTGRLGNYKSSSTIEIIGISGEEFWRRNGSPTAEQLEDLHIDHIVPLSWFDLTNEDHVRVSSHWTNFQYLSEEDNLIKNNNYAGRPDAILGYKEDFDIQKHVKDMIQFLNETNNF